MKSPKAAFKERIQKAVLAQIMQGADARGLSLSVAVGVAFGLFPLLGFTTLLCVLVGATFRLNQPILHTVNYLMFPLQLGAIPIFGFLGSYFFEHETLDLRPNTLAAEFSADAGAALAKYGMVGLRAVLLWAIVAPLVIFVVHKSCLPSFTRLQSRIKG